MINGFITITEKDLVALTGEPQPYCSQLLNFLRRQGIAQRTGHRKKIGRGRPARLWKVPLRFTLDMSHLRIRPPRPPRA